MIIYKFKISFEDHDDFLRELELRADQTFEDFHQALLGNLGLDPGMLASFFICDHRFRKQKEIQLSEMNPSAPEEHKESGTSPVTGSRDDIEQVDLKEDKAGETEQEAKGGQSDRTLLMHECAMKDFIDDPHQRLLFVYDYINQWTFYIELVKIMPAPGGITYPRFSKSTGPVPRELLATPKQMPGVETPSDFSFGDSEITPGDLSDFDQIEGADDTFEDNTGEGDYDPDDEK